MRDAMEIELDIPITPYDKSTLLEQGAAGDEAAPQLDEPSSRVLALGDSSFLGPAPASYEIPSRSAFGNIPSGPWSRLLHA
jgi:hypothetical protein